MTTEARSTFVGAVAVTTAVVLIAQQIGGKATRDALFLAGYEPADLPKIMIASAIISLVAVVVVSALLARWGPMRVVPAAFALSAGLYAAEWWFSTSFPELVAISVYLHVAIFGSIVISGFWSVINERFDPSTAKKQIARIATGATAGGLIGGLLASQVATWLGAEAMLLTMCGLNGVCGLGLVYVGRGVHHEAPEPNEERTWAVGVLRRSSYLRYVAVLVFLLAVTEALLDYVLKTGAVDFVKQSGATEETERAELISFFALFYTVTGFLTLVVQWALGRRALGRLGLGGTLAIMPVGVLISGGFAAVFQQFWASALLRGTESVFANSLFRSAYEILYAPVAPKEKRPTKTLIDVAVNRLGDAGGSGLVLLLLAVLPDAGSIAFVVISLVIAALMIWIARRVQLGYVGALGNALRTGTLKLEHAEVLDATTRRTLDSTMAVDREVLLDEIRKLRQKSEPPPAAGAKADVADAAAVEPASRADLAADVAILCGRDLGAIRAVLERRPVDPRLTSFVVPLLEKKSTAPAAMRALSTIASKVAGQLVDALLDRDIDAKVRRRLARVCGLADEKRAADGLVSALSDPSFPVRYDAARALTALVGRKPEHGPAQEVIHRIVLDELARDKDHKSEHDVLEGEQTSATNLDELLELREEHLLRQVFSLLGIVHDRDLLALALRALRTGDPSLHGTAVEYLDNILPAEVRRALEPHLELSKKAPKRERPQRTHADIAEELVRSMSNVKIDREALRKQ
jgi:MFS family permease